MKDKTLDYVLGMITGIAIMVAAWSCTSPLNADGFVLGDSKWNPLYVKIVE